MIRKKIGKVKNRSDRRLERRKLSIRKKVSGTSARPRLCVTKSNKNMFVQVVDDITNKTIMSFQTFGKNAVPGTSKSVDGAKKLGAHIAAKLKEKGVSAVVFDRNGARYTGSLAALAGTIRENGVQI
jgi:large subunit ribosomal protein L18